MTTKTTKTTRKPKAKAKPSRRSKKPAATITSTEPKERRVTKEQMVIQALCRPEGRRSTS